ncbi:hypothetical protein PPAR_a1228 [Pseudoalteromonas paragorgicola KMM 3548]|nr:hypothetical protein [Pseudoalteromonas distincta KMM 3548]
MGYRALGLHNQYRIVSFRCLRPELRHSFAAWVANGLL